MTQELSLKMGSGPSAFEIIRDLGRYARRLVTDVAAREVLMMIADRTIGCWNAPSKIITETQFIEGVYAADGTMYHAGTGLGRTKLYACLKALRELGAITVRKVKKGAVVLNEYSINMEWAGALMGKIKVARKATQAATGQLVKLRQRPVRNTNIPPVSPVRQTDTLREEEQTYLKEERKPQGGIAASIARGIEVTKRNAQRVLDKARSAPSSGNLFESVWQPAIATHWPSAVVMPLTAKQRGQLGHFVKNWPEKDATVADFLAWVVENWRKVYMAKFIFLAGKVDYPEYPSLDFLMGFKNGFLDSWARRRSIDRDAKLTPEDRLRSQLAYQGFTGEGVEREAAKIMAGREDRGRMVKERERLATMAATIETRARVVEGRELQPVASRTTPQVPRLTKIEERPTIAPLPKWQDED